MKRERKSPLPTAIINQANASAATDPAFREAQLKAIMGAEFKLPASPPSRSAEHVEAELALVLEAHALQLRGDWLAQRADKQASAKKGGKRSGEARHHTERDRRIHDAHDDGKGLSPKQIAGDRKILGKRRLSASQIRRILKAPRP